MAAAGANAAFASLIDSRDALLYVLRQLDQIELFCQSQRGEAGSISTLHYDELLRQVRLIREKRTKP